jgi:hypothetical protein
MMRGSVRAAVIVLCAASLPVAGAAKRADPARRAALEAKSKVAVAAKPPGPSAATHTLVSSQALAAFEQEKKTKGAPRPLLTLSPAVIQVIGGAKPTPSCATPKITQISAAPPLDPGDEVILNGCGFGSGGGNELRLVGNFPGGYAKLKPSIWHDDAIKAVLDPATRGAFDQADTKLQVVRGDLKLSNQVPIAFRAAREVVLVEEKTTVTLACGGDKSDGHFNYCHSPFDTGMSLPVMHNFSMAGIHWVNDGDLDNEGSDEMSLTLKNGFKTCGYGWEWWYEYPGTGFASVPHGYADGRTSLKIRMDWGLTHDGMQYHVDVYAIGPAGVPYH